MYSELLQMSGDQSLYSTQKAELRKLARQRCLTELANISIDSVVFQHMLIL